MGPLAEVATSAYLSAGEGGGSRYFRKLRGDGVWSRQLWQAR